MWVDNQPEWEELTLDSFSTFCFLQQNTIGNHLSSMIGTSFWKLWFQCIKRRLAGKKKERIKKLCEQAS